VGLEVPENLMKHRHFHSIPVFHCTVKFMDNLNIYGIPDDEPRPSRGKPRGKRRKPFAIECRLVPNPNTDSSTVMRARLGLRTWWTWGRYETATRRDQAYAALVKKQLSTPPYWWKWEYRKRDD
jgi:hypothetical protein